MVCNQSLSPATSTSGLIKEEKGRTQALLDRAICNLYWLTLLPGTKVTHLCVSTSNQLLVLVEIINVNGKRKEEISLILKKC